MGNFVDGSLSLATILLRGLVMRFRRLAVLADVIIAEDLGSRFMGVGWGVVQHGGVVKMFSGLVMRLRRPVVGFFGPLRRLPRPTLRDDKAALCELTGALRQFFSPCGCTVARRLLHEGSRERYGGVQPTGWRRS
ncbi:MAG: hypothetical protein QOE41_4570 [Mycobacterium sp.]|nr:hypothetical protein [Mycobacterium sp.]